MDLDFAIDQLGTFETFGKNIGDVLTGIPELLQSLISFFVDAEGNTAETSSIIEAGSSTED